MFEKEKARLAKNGLYLMRCNEAKRSNKELVMVAVNQNGLALQFASPELRNDKDIVLKAVEQNGLALRFASDRLKKRQRCRSRGD